MPNYSFRSSGMRRKQNLDFHLSLSLLPASFAFLSPFFFFCWAFTRLPFGGKRFGKKPEDREIFLKEVRVGRGTRFSLEFSAQSYTFFFFAFSLACLTESRSFGYRLQDLISRHKLVVKVV